jgi:2-succinyl-5-enolpyruvyl-6-hydroxy-3-cyclohexene-1-carboxylate synthase
VPDDATVRSLADRIARAPHGFIACGPASLSQRADAEAVRELARRTGYAVLAEGTSQLRFTGPERETWPALDAFDLVLGSAAAAESIRPDLVLQLGAAPVGSAFTVNLGRVPKLTVGGYGWADPESCAREVVQAGLREVVRALLSVLPERAGDEVWLARIAALDRAAWEAVSATLESGEHRSEGAMTRALVSALPREALLAVSNSLPVRHLDAFVPGAAADVRVLSQRGAAGIDGIVSGAVGAAGAAGAPTALLLGDLALLHDLSGLELARRVQVPFAIVVLNNDGGRIFEQLPVARAETTAPLLDRWTTPHGLSFEHAAALFGHRYARVEHARDLTAAVREAIAREGCTLIEAKVDPHGAAIEQERLRARFDAALAEVA